MHCGPSIDHSRRTPQRGIALVIVLLMVMAMAIIVGTFSYSMKVESRLAFQTDASGELNWLGLSAVEYAKWFMAQEQRVPGQQSFSGLNQRWAGGPGPMDLADDPLQGLSLSNVEIGPGRVSIRIIDQERRININQADAIQLETALNRSGAPGESGEVLAAALKDWTDPDDFVTSGGGAESAYYLSLDPPYRAKNGPIDDIYELLKIKGITPAQFFGGPSASGRRTGAKSPLGQAVGSGATDSVGLVDLFCAISSGRVNVNTAPEAVLEVVLRGDSTLAHHILQVRSGPDQTDGTEDDEPARNDADIGRLLGPVSPGQVSAQSRLTALSATFEVEIEATLGRSRARFVALIQRRGVRDFQTLVFRPE
jgi:general secretion pathway protein K